MATKVSRSKVVKSHYKQGLANVFGFKAVQQHVLLLVSGYTAPSTQPFSAKWSVNSGVNSCVDTSISTACTVDSNGRL